MALGVAAAASVDQSAGPILLRGTIEPHFTAGLVILIGMYRGTWSGMAAGWFAGLVLASGSGEHLGQSILTLGLVGFMAGRSDKMTDLGFPLVNLLAFAALLTVEDLLGNLLALAVLGVTPSLGLGGLLLTIFTMGIFLWSNPPEAGRKTAPSDSQRPLKSDPVTTRRSRPEPKGEGGMFT